MIVWEFVREETMWTPMTKGPSNWLVPASIPVRYITVDEDGRFVVVAKAGPSPQPFPTLAEAKEWVEERYADAN